MFENILFLIGKKIPSNIKIHEIYKFVIVLKYNNFIFTSMNKYKKYWELDEIVDKRINYN